MADLNVNEHTAHDKASNSVFSLRGPEVFKIVSRIKKIQVSVLLTSKNVLVLNESHDVVDVLPLSSLESVVISKDFNSVIAIHLYDRPDVLLEVGDKRTDFLLQLIQAVEQ